MGAHGWVTLAVRHAGGLPVARRGAAPYEEPYQCRRTAGCCTGDCKAGGVRRKCVASQETRGRPYCGPGQHKGLKSTPASRAAHPIAYCRAGTSRQNVAIPDVDVRSERRGLLARGTCGHSPRGVRLATGQARRSRFDSGRVPYPGFQGVRFCQGARCQRVAKKGHPTSDLRNSARWRGRAARYRQRNVLCRCRGRRGVVLPPAYGGVVEMEPHRQ